MDRKRPARTALRALALLVSLAGAATAADHRALRSPSQPAAVVAVRGPVQRVGPWLVDGEGRVVVLHGWNVVRKNPPFVRMEFGPSDARLLAAEGFTVVRIGFIWEAVEPEPGRYDDAYIARVLQLDSLLARHGIRTIVDFHQDGWSREFNGDGAPAWATLGSSLNRAFAAFWRDDPGPGGVGIQTRFVRAWEHVARALRDRDNVVALDPLNEPYPGSDYPAPCGPFTRCGEFERGALADFYRRVIAAIRSAGAPHVVLPEGVAESGYDTPVLPAFDDPQTAFNFHFYCPATQLSSLEVPVGRPSPEAEACAPIVRSNIARFTDYASRLGVPALLTELSCNDVHPDNAQTVDHVARTFTSWVAWMYYTAADDPFNCPRQGLLLDDAKPGSQANAKQAKLDAFAVPYAAAIAGTPESTDLERASRTYTLSYRSSPVPGAELRRGALTAIFVPERMYPDGYVAEVSGARIRSRADAPWLLLGAEPDLAVSVRVTPCDPGSGSDGDGGRACRRPDRRRLPTIAIPRAKR
jgi:endoglycosylceramidase